MAVMIHWLYDNYYRRHSVDYVVILFLLSEIPKYNTNSRIGIISNQEIIGW